MSRYNKAWAAGVAQALIQLVAAFVPFEPDLEQALGVALTAAIVWAVPNRPPADPSASADVTLRSPAWAGLAAIGLALVLGACASVGDRLADRLLGPDCGPASRVLRAELLTERVLARHPEAGGPALAAALAAMRAAAERGTDLDSAAATYQAALAVGLAPVAGGSQAEPLLLRLSRLPGLAEDFLLIRGKVAGFCAAI